MNPSMHGKRGRGAAVTILVGWMAALGLLVSPDLAAQSERQEVREHRGEESTKRRRGRGSSGEAGRPHRGARARRGGQSSRSRDRRGEVRDHRAKAGDRRVKVRDHRSRSPDSGRPQGTPRPRLRVESWIGRERPLEEIPAPSLPRTRSRDEISQPLTVVLAGSLELDGQAYSRRNAPKNVLIIADRLRLNGRVSFRLQGRRSRGRSSRLRRSGGHVALFAREIACEDGGRLVVDTSTRFDDAHGGDLVLAAEAYFLGDRRVSGKVFAASDCVRSDGSGATRSRGARRAVRAGKRAHRREFASGGARTGDPAGSGSASGGEPGRVRPFDRLAAAAAALEEEDLGRYGHPDAQPVLSRFARYAVSKWAVEMLPEAIAEVQQAEITAGRGEAVRALRRARALVDSNRFPVLESELAREEGLDARAAVEAYHAGVEKLRELKRELEGTLWTGSLSVRPPGQPPRELQVFTESHDLRTRLPPTDVLIRPEVADGRRVAGVMSFDPEEPETVYLELEVELSVDPWIEALAARKLSARGEDYGGLFTSWTLSPRPIRADGILDSEVRVDPSQAGARIRLTLDAERSTLVLAQLASRSGVPLELDWQSTRDKNVEGSLELAVSLLRRAGAEIEVDGEGRVTNRGETELTLGYLQLGEDRFEALDQGVAVQPGETVALDLPADADPAEVRVPSESIEFTGTDPYRFGRDFRVVNGEGLVETVSVANRLGHDERRGGGLEYVEIDLVYRNGDAESSAPRRYRLAPVGAEGDEVTVSFVKTGPGIREVEVSGTAHYEGGSRQSLEPTTFSTLSIKVTEQMLPPLE